MSVKGMIFLEEHNKIIEQMLTQRIGEGSSRPAEPMDLRLCDFDDAQYNLVIDGSNLIVSLAYKPYATLERFGAKKMLTEVYPTASITQPKAGYDLSMQFNLDQVNPSGAGPLIAQIANLKRNLLGAPFNLCFQALSNGTGSSLSPIQIPFRQTEKMFIQPQADRIVIVYSVCFEDKTDQAIARVFLQEFDEARRHVNNAPPVNFSKDPPLELRGVPGLQPTPDLVGYLSFAIFSSHVATNEKREKAVSLIQGFRNYLHYHIKCSKGYLHSRMRKRVNMLLTVLNRAHPAKDPSTVSKKTMSGKTFSRA